MRSHDSGRACHPRFRASTLRYYCLDDVTAFASDLARGRRANNATYGSAPYRVSACTPYARRFFFGVSSGILEDTTDTELTGALNYNWTAHVLFRLLTSPSVGTFGALLSIRGDTSDATGAENSMCGIYIRTTSSGVGFQVYWENAIGTDVFFNTSPTVSVFDWTLVTVRKRNTTALGPTGTCVVDVFVNGVLIGTSGLLNNTSNPVTSTARVRIGGDETPSPAAAVNVLDYDIAHVSLCAEPLSNEEIENDARRVRMLSFFTRLDVQVMAEQEANLLSPARRLNLTNIEENGRDVVLDVTIDDDNETATSTASVNLLREEGDSSLASLRTDTKWNLTNPSDPLSWRSIIQEGATTLVISTARVPLGIRATSRDLFEKFRGVVDEIDNGGEKISIRARDLGGELIDTFIEQEANYGTSLGVAVEGEMQLILDDNDNDPLNNFTFGLSSRSGSYDPITLYTRGSPNWQVKEWRQRREPVLTALRTLAGQIGWDVRFLWINDPLNPGWRLTFYGPRRDRLDADVVVDESDVLSVGSLSKSHFNVRNVVRVVYPSGETTTPAAPVASGYTVRTGWTNVDGEGNRVAAFVEVESPTSIDYFGKRLFCEFCEEGTSQIDTISEAFDMAFGALRDMEEPEIDKSIVVSAIPELEPGDMLFIRSIRQLFTAAQRLAIRSVSHSFGEQATSTIEMRGKPSLGFKRWLRLEARPGNARPGVSDSLDALTDVRPGTLLSVVRNLLDRTPYFTGGKFLQIRNPEFSAFSAGLALPPDGWEVAAGSWGNQLNVSTTSRSGDKSILLDAVGGVTPRLRSALFAIPGDATFPLSLEAVWQRPSGDDQLQINVEWYNAARTLISTTNVFPGSGIYGFPAVGATTGTWFTSRAQGITPPGAGTARFARLVLTPRQVTAPNGPILVDSVSMYRCARAMRAGSTGSPAGWGAVPASGTITSFYNQRMDSVSVDPFYDRGSQSLVETALASNNRGYCFLCSESGTYHISAVASVVNQGGNFASKTVAIQLVRNGRYNITTGLRSSGTIVASFQKVETFSTVSTGYFCSTNIDLVAGDTITLDLAAVIAVGSIYVSGAGGAVEFSNLTVRMAQAD